MQHNRQVAHGKPVTCTSNRSMNIEIRHAELDDYKALQTIHAQPKAVWGTLQLPYPSSEAWKKRLAEKPGSMTQLVACVDGALVGALMLYQESRSPRRRHVAGLGMVVDESRHGQGVGTALTAAAMDLADNWLNLVRVELTVYTDNEPAIALYKKFEFETEGVFKKYAFRDGRYADVYAMARFRPDRV